MLDKPYAFSVVANAREVELLACKKKIFLRRVPEETIDELLETDLLQVSNDTNKCIVKFI